ncbi:MFS transporter [Agrococcus jejuensis]|uniref:Predicted arabinose efflux permease, MFS family n=1 Tax=Agrococcus jejuensis TaxID=399736 RepID=A0A1G7ZYL2_9MICO|nr:MFS transporter [Agrococcus jejuensis]SDH13743.1 Predicted arabinose efflux permease, MFS family [Agrococcus jejuensis]
MPDVAAGASGRDRLAVVASGVGGLSVLYATQPILDALARDLGATESAAAWTIAGSTLGVALSAPIAGAISDRLGRRAVIVWALVGVLATTLLCALVPTLWALVAVRILQGMLVPFVFSTSIAMIPEAWPGSLSVRLGALQVAGTAMGGFLGRLVSGLAAPLGWRWSFVAVALVVALALAAVVAWLPRDRGFSPSPSFGAGVRGFGSHLRDGRILATCLVGAALLALQVGSFTYGSLALVAPPHGLAEWQVSLVFVVFLLAIVVTPRVGGVIARVGLVPTFLAAVVIGVVGLAIAAFGAQGATWAIVVGLALTCVAVFAGQSCATGFVARHVVVARSSAVGLYLTAYYLGGAVAAVALGPVFLGFGWLGCVLALAVVLALSAPVAALAWRGTPASSGSRIVDPGP